MVDDRNAEGELPGKVPFVILDTDANPPPRRRRILLPALAGGGLLVLLAGSAVFLFRRPPGIPPAPFPITTEVAFARPVPPESQPVPEEGDPVVEESAEDPGSPPPSKTDVAAVPRAEEPARKIEDSPVPPRPSPEPERIPPPVNAGPVPAPAAPTEPSPVESLLRAAADIREAELDFREVAERFDSGALKNANLRELAYKMDRIEQKLKEARGAYDRLGSQVPDPKILERRVRVLDELLESLKEGRARIKVPLAILKAETLEAEARLVAKEALDGFQPYSREAQALDAKAEAAIAQLREARGHYTSIRKDVPDPAEVDRRVRNLELLIDRLEERFPSVKSAR